MTKDTAQFLLGLLDRQQLQVGGPDFERSVEQVLIARKELQAIVNAESRPQ